MSDDPNEVKSTPPAAATASVLPHRKAAAGAGPPPGAVADDVPCASCGYNLRGLKIDGACPECGSRVRPSIRLRWMSDPDVKTVHRTGAACQGTALLLAGNCIALVAFTIAWFLGNDVVVLSALTVAGSALLFAVFIFYGNVNVRHGHASKRGWFLRLFALATAGLSIHFAVQTSRAMTAIFRTTPLPSSQLLEITGLGAILLWACEAHQITHRIDQMPFSTIRAWGKVSIGFLAVSLLIAAIAGNTSFACGGLLMLPITMLAATAFFWMVGRELTA
jgi:hypothetical protein